MPKRQSDNSVVSTLVDLAVLADWSSRDTLICSRHGYFLGHCAVEYWQVTLLPSNVISYREPTIANGAMMLGS